MKVLYYILFIIIQRKSHWLFDLVWRNRIFSQIKSVIKSTGAFLVFLKKFLIIFLLISNCTTIFCLFYIIFKTFWIFPSNITLFGQNLLYFQCLLSGYDGCNEQHSDFNYVFWRSCMKEQCCQSSFFSFMLWQISWRIVVVNWTNFNFTYNRKCKLDIWWCCIHYVFF